eukprot:scaffold1141_cov128-Isochrysis_galbana.AAC.10
MGDHRATHTRTAIGTTLAVMTDDTHTHEHQRYKNATHATYTCGFAASRLHTGPATVPRLTVQQGALHRPARAIVSNLGTQPPPPAQTPTLRSARCGR